MTELRTENDAVIKVAQDAARAETAAIPLDLDKVYAFATPDGPKLLDLSTGDYATRLPAPRRKAGRVIVEDIGSFLQYYAKHADLDTETFVNVDSRTITAVLNADSADAPRWGDHRLILQLRTTDAWNAWNVRNRTQMSQRDFAEFIEDHIADIREPNGATMLEIASTFQAKTTVKFSSATRLSSGDTNLVWEETTDASAGKGNQKVPTSFTLGLRVLELPVPEGEEPVVHGMLARFRYRIERGGELRVTYLLADPAAVLRDAVMRVVGQVEVDAGIAIFRGFPK